jgi:hypothetical protein
LSHLHLDNLFNPNHPEYLRTLEVLVAAQRALLGEISENMRAITIKYDEKSIILRYIFDKEPSEEDLESVSFVETEIAAGQGENEHISSEIVQIRFPGTIPQDELRVYRRKEILE